MCLIIYFVAPAEPPAETETHGWLEPANDPFPQNNACIGDLQKFRPNGMLFSLGKAGVWFQKKPGGKRPLLTVGICTSMSAEFKNGQLFFNADIYDLNHELVARIEQNEFHLVPGKYAYQSRPDRHTLKIVNRGGDLLISVYFRNKDAIDIAGTFTCLDGKEARVEKTGELTMGGPKGRITWDKACFINTGGFVAAERGWDMGQTPCWACDVGHPSCPLVCAMERAREAERVKEIESLRK
jgi:hypothetical protein